MEKHEYFIDLNNRPISYFFNNT